MLHLGIDIGSKTVKLVVVDESGELLYSTYERHLSNVKETFSYTLRNARVHYPDEPMTVGVTGSAGMQLSFMLDLPFVQEVIACREALAHYLPDADVAIEIGGEDSKILFLTGGEELRMNSTCAGGTGGFIDTIAGMLDANAEKLNYYAHGCRTVHPIASRCAVFAQSDVRPLINEGVPKEDIAGSVFDAVARQCISGLACGRSIKGNVALLGGPLHFLSSLRERFKVRLGLSDAALRIPANGHLFVAQGAALAMGDGPRTTIGQLIERLDEAPWDEGAQLERLEPLFESPEEYELFRARHAEDAVLRDDLQSYEGRVFLGVDSGSEAIKYAVVGEDGQLLRTYYRRSAGNVIDAARDMLIDLWKHLPLYHDGTPAARIAHATVTGYGEDFLKAAYAFDSGEVETVAHARAALHLAPDADFVFDIGGQDMKCIYLRNGEVDDVVLNEACSSGCGALLSGMAWSMNVRLDRFLSEAVAARNPLDLGTRCTVFMTSRVRHAQKEGACLGDIAAGLAYSVVRNALYKVLRLRDPSALGRTIVVQGGTFLNDAVLRAFEKLTGRTVIRPDIAGHMGAFGAALLARERAGEQGESSLLSRRRVEKLESSQKTVRCARCPNSCVLVKTTFLDDGARRTFVVGNRCERGLDACGETVATARERCANLFDFRDRRLFSYRSRAVGDAPRGEVGIMRALGMYDWYPFWFTFFDCLGFRIVLSHRQGEAFRGRAIETIPSESLCYPAKRAHGHLFDLLDRGVRMVFAPVVDSVRDGAPACPVLACYALALDANVDAVEELGARLLMPRLPSGVVERSDFDEAAASLGACLANAGAPIPEDELSWALARAHREQRRFELAMSEEGARVVGDLRVGGGKGIVCAGRPYHADPAIHHGIPDLLQGYGYAVLTQDSVVGLGSGKAASAMPGRVPPPSWGHPRRIVDAARFVASEDCLDMVEMYSFGCGLDAVTVDRARDVLEAAGKSLTALKIDEMADLASVKIRIRSMMAAQRSREGARAARFQGKGSI